MSTEAQVVFTGDASDVLQEYQKQEQAESKRQDGIRKTAKETREAAAEERRLHRDAQRIKRDVETAQERYNRKLQEAKAHLQSGRIEQEEFNRATMRYRNELRNATDANGDFGESLLAAGAGLTAVAALLASATAEAKRYREEVDKSNLSLDEQARKLAVQAGLSAVQGEEAQLSVLEVAKANATTGTDAMLAATQLVSSGFSVDDSTGEALDVTLKALSSSNRMGENPTALIQSASQFLSAYGMEKNASNLADVLVRIRGLFASTDVQLNDLTDFARAAPVARQAGLNVTDFLSAGTLLREQMPAAEASTAIRSIIQQVSTAGGYKDKTEILESMKMTPEDVNFVGEDFRTVISRLKTGVETLPEGDRATALAKLVEKVNVGPLLTLMSGQDKMQRFDAMQSDEAGFVQGVNTAQSGAAAGDRRFKVQQQIDDLNQRQESFRRIQENNALENARRQAYTENDPIFGAAALMLSNRFHDAGILMKDAIGIGLDRTAGLTEQQVGNVEAFGQSSYTVEQLRTTTQPQVNMQPVVDAINKQTTEMTRQASDQTSAIRESKPKPVSPQSQLSRGNR